MLKQQIQSDSTNALKSGDQFLVGTLRMLLASITNKEKEKRYKISKQKPDAIPAFAEGSGVAREEQLAKESELNDEEVVEVIASEIKKRKDAIVLYEQGKRPELADREQKEIEILKKISACAIVRRRS